MKNLQLAGTLLAFFAALIVINPLFPAPGQSRQKRILNSANFQNGTFQNPIYTPSGLENGGSVMWEFFTGGSKERTPARPLPVQKLNPAMFHKRPDGLRLTWLGHATILAEIDGKRILLDPVFSERASPVGFAGPRRFHEVPVAISDLPELDAVIISHDHYDHLDRHSIRNLKSKTRRFIVPLGVGAHLESWDIPASQITELDWWEEFSQDGVRLICTPARHFSGRSLTDRNTTLWSSWAVIGKNERFFFSGDSGYFPGFKKIGAKLGPFHASIIAIGAYSRHWPAVHMNPEEAIQAHKDLNARYMVPIHWGTFDLALHAWHEPAERTLKEARLKNATVSFPRPGESVERAGALAGAWWRDLRQPERESQELSHK